MGKICREDYWPRKGIRTAEKAKPGSTKYTKGKKSKGRKAREVRVEEAAKLMRLQITKEPSNQNLLVFAC